MKLKIRYENEYQTIVLNRKDTEDLWVSLSLEGEGLSQEERESLIQDAWEEKYNKPDYNNWHKHEQREGFYKSQAYEDDDTGFAGEGGGTWCEPLPSEVRDKSIFTKDMDELERKQEYEDICDWIRKVLIKKPEWAEAFISVRMDGMSIREYAAMVGDSENNITQKLNRAAKKLKEFYPNRKI